MKLNAILSLLGRFEKPIIEYIRRDRMPGVLLCTGTVLFAGPSWPTLVALWSGIPWGEFPKISIEPFSILTQCVGLGLIALGILAWIHAVMQKYQENDLVAERLLHREYGSLPVGERQVRFKEVYKRPARVEVMDALMQHGSNPMLLCADFKRGGDLLKLDGDWFSLKNRRHKRERGLLSVTYFITGIVSFAFLGVGTFLLTNGIALGNRIEAIAGVMAFGLMLVFGGVALGLLPRIAALAAAERVVSEGVAIPHKQ